MLDRVQSKRWLLMAAVLVFPGTVMAMGAGPVGGYNYMLLSTGVVPLLYAAAIGLLLALEEGSWINYIPLACVPLIYLVMLGDVTKICRCTVKVEPVRIDGFAQIGPDIDMHACFTLALPLLAFTFGCLLLPHYNRKTFAYRFVAFAAAFMPYAALSFIDMSIGYRD